MNEQRNMKKNFLSQRPDPLKEDWEGLILRLKTLMTNALVLSKMDLFHAIGRQIIVLEQNKPNKKIYRVVLKFKDKAESELGMATKEYTL